MNRAISEMVLFYICVLNKYFEYSKIERTTEISDSEAYLQKRIFQNYFVVTHRRKYFM